MLALLWEIVLLLPATYRRVLELRVYEGFSTRVTADCLHASRTNISARLYRAVQLLQQRIDAWIEPDPPRSSRTGSPS